MKVVDESTIDKYDMAQYVDVKSGWYTFLTVYQVLITVLSLFGNSAVLFLSHRFEMLLVPSVQCIGTVISAPML